MAEHSAVNRRVAGSNPAWGAFLCLLLKSAILRGLRVIVFLDILKSRKSARYRLLGGSG